MSGQPLPVNKIPSEVNATAADVTDESSLILTVLGGVESFRVVVPLLPKRHTHSPVPVRVPVGLCGTIFAIGSPAGARTIRFAGASTRFPGSCTV